ncbi:bifunctional 3'-5' exonuclease/DNA polymerase [Rathayibacter soli]|uniref:bifunctional 3'-5' exonuclease/DNA polymerase n=1 Tax=Rathayibacter soli TaxID=3144168 RepID=UPI0027E4F6D5|nr:bifunctional 3'-5' exonuclease/DNA polymerase [Glaciibacter superstes]
MYIALARTSAGDIVAAELDDDGNVTHEHILHTAELPAFVAAREDTKPRWVWDSTARWYPELLTAGLRIDRCVDLTLCHAILRSSTLTVSSELTRTDDGQWDAMEPAVDSGAERSADATLFDLDANFDTDPDTDQDTDPDTDLDVRREDRVAENFEHDRQAREPQPQHTSPKQPTHNPVSQLKLQLAAVEGASVPGRIRLLLAAESAGALIAAEMRFAGLPWQTSVHDELLTQLLGPRVPYGARPAKMEALTATIRTALGAPNLNPDSQAELLRALRAAGLVVSSTRAWELRELTHPVIAPLLEYKKLARLLTANGWTWMDSWIVDGRFHPDYVPGAVVTGRWATRGGGALQLPKQIRGAVVADPGWKLVVADAAQLEPRILAALSADTAMAGAGRGHDLYDGIVASGAVDTRAHAKVAMLGAMYGATTGDSARLGPRLARAYPRAIALVEDAARTGERGGIVTTWLGRSSPKPGPRWLEIQARAYDPDASPTDERNARSRARDWGRFTRNFVVQGSAAEWALCWMAELRRRLCALPAAASATGGAPEPFARRPHLVFFLHDEVIVHAPEALAEAVAAEVRAAAAEAGRLLFGSFPVEFALTVAIVDNYAQAK